MCAEAGFKAKYDNRPCLWATTGEFRWWENAKRTGLIEHRTVGYISEALQYMNIMPRKVFLPNIKLLRGHSSRLVNIAL